MSKIKYLYQTDNERLTRVLRGLSVGLPDALYETKPLSYAAALNPTRDDQIMKILNQYLRCNLPECIISDTYQNTRKVNYITKYIEQTDNVLDFGGGHGFITSEVANKCQLPYIWLIDQQSYNITDSRIISNCITPQDFATWGLPFTNNFFDVTLCFMVLHHIKNPRDYIAELTRCTKKYLIIHEHNCENLADKYLLDLVHGLYMYVWKSNDYDLTAKFSQFTAWYHPKKYFDNILSRDFILVDEWITNHTTKNYMQVWRKKSKDF